MFKRSKRWISVMLAVILAVTLVPFGGERTAEANSIPEIVNFKNSVAEPADPTPVTNEVVDIIFDYPNLTDSILESIYFEINGQVVNDNRARMSDTQAHRAVFENVRLQPGLNRLVVFVDGISPIRSIPAWVIYTEVATVRQLLMDGQAFPDLNASNPLYPRDNDVVQTRFPVTGYANNSEWVIVSSNLEGGRRIFTRMNDGFFSFTIGQGSVDLNLNKGNNDISISAENPTRTYLTERSFIYNNGESFLYNTRASKAGETDYSMLYLEPTFEGGTNIDDPYLVDIVTDIKLNRDPIPGSYGLSHDRMILKINDSVTPHEVIFEVDDSDPANLELSASYDDATGTTIVKVLDYVMTDDYYLIKDFGLEGIRLDTSISEQAMNITFHSASTNYFDPEVQIFQFYYSNPNEVYVDQIVLKATGQELSEYTEIGAVTTNDVVFQITTGNSPDGVSLFLNDALFPTGTLTGSGNNFEITISKNQIQEGENKVRFVPYTESHGVTEHKEVGQKIRWINYNPEPYVYLVNIADGQTFNNNITEPSLNIGDTIIDGPALQLRTINIPGDDYQNIRILLNSDNTFDKLRPADKPGSNPNIPGNEFHFKFGGGSSAPRPTAEGWELKPGVNRITIEVYPGGSLDTDGSPLGGVKPITTSIHEFFYFSDVIPAVPLLDIEPNFAQNNEFRRLEDANYRFYTQENKVKFHTSVANASVVEFKLEGVDEDGGSLEIGARWSWNTTLNDFELISGSAGADGLLAIDDYERGDYDMDNGNAYFVTEELDLLGRGVYTMTVTVVNNSGIAIPRMLEIVREPASFIVHYPVLDRDTRVGRINANYTRVYLEAEGATEIIHSRRESVTQKKVVEMRDGETRELFVFEIKGLRRGTNTIPITIKRGTVEEKGEITLVNADTPVPGAEFKDSISKRNIRAFDNKVQLSFPRNTVLMRKDGTHIDQALSPTRDILLGIADMTDGRVNKMLHPSSISQQEKDTSRFRSQAPMRHYFDKLTNPNERFRPVSDLIWIDGGAVPLSNGTQGDVLYGSGTYPYEPDNLFLFRDERNEYIASAPGTLTLSYDPKIVSSSWRYVTVYHYAYDETYGTREWKNIGGTVNNRNNTISVPIQEFGYYIVMYMYDSFDDVIGHAWAKDMLDTLYSKGIMRARDANRFEANEMITRGEFAQLIVKAFDIPLDYKGTPSFIDVRPDNLFSNGLYEYKYIETAARAGIVRGTFGNTYSPNQLITRQQAATIIARAADLRLETDLARARAQLEGLYTDTADMRDDYALAPILAVSRAKLMEGEPNVTQNISDKPTFSFRPNVNMRRSEAAAVVMRVMLNAKRIPHL